MSHDPEMETGRHEPKRVLSVFLCYASEDEPTVRDLYHRLSADGISPWLDVENIDGGQDWILEIKKAIEASDMAIVCLSKSSVKKTGFVQRELKYVLAADEKRPGGASFLIPLRIEECEVPDALSNKQWVDHFKQDGYERLLRSLGRRAQQLGREAPITRRAVANEECLPVRYATGRELDQSKAFFAASTTGSSPITLGTSMPEQLVGGTWEVEAKWDASHRVPNRGDGKRVNLPELVEWSPDGKQLVTACDAFGMTRWNVDDRWNDRRVGGGTPSYAYGQPTRFFWSPDGGLVLLEAQTGLNHWWTVQGEYGDIIRHAVANEFAPWGWDWMNVYGFHRTRCFTPWRPGKRQLLIARDDGPRLDLIDVSALPEVHPEPEPIKPPTSFLGYALSLMSSLASRPSASSDKSEHLADVPTISSVSFAPLGAQVERIMRYAWHPSGKYVAVTTGHRDNESMRRVHILHYETGEIVAYTSPSTTALGWSPGGRLLFCQQWTFAGSSERKIDTVVWDSHTWALRELTEEERSQPWARHFEFSYLGVTKDALNANGTLSASAYYQSSPPPGSRAGVFIRRNGSEAPEMALPVKSGVLHVAWSPIDPYRLATVGGADAPSSLRIWTLT